MKSGESVATEATATCFSAREKNGGKAERKERGWIFAHCQIKAELECLNIRQTEGRIPQTLAVCPLSARLLSDQGPCDISTV